MGLRKVGIPGRRTEGASSDEALAVRRGAFDAGALRRPAHAAAIVLASVLAVGLNSAHSIERSESNTDASGARVQARAVDDSNNANLRMAQNEGTSFDVRDAVGEQEKPIPLNIRMSASAIDKYKFFMVVGLPEGFEMSSGFPTKNAWLVSVNNIEGLQILPSSSFLGSVRLQVMLFKGKDDVPETRTVALTVISPKIANAPSRETPVAATTPAREAAPAREPIVTPVAPKPAKRSISDEEEGRSMVRAYEMLQNADIAAARLVYETMAMRGSAKAAFAMGQTYDPDFLQNFVVEGLKADINQARKWYKKALDLGSPEAQARLAALDRTQ